MTMNAQDISRVACVGGGTIGFSWAVLFAQHGLRVKLYDVSDEVLEPEQMPRCKRLMTRWSTLP